MAKGQLMIIKTDGWLSNNSPFGILLKFHKLAQFFTTNDNEKATFYAFFLTITNNLRDAVTTLCAVHPPHSQ